mmetsp:Transcript_163722/g.520316  ORF Transcript_163722/g.520316 Transcript_163722/m.520316 type:complete len:223 (+) Transcript_163722:807-1475(+)
MQDARVRLAVLDLQLQEAEGEATLRLLHHEGLPAALLNLLQETVRAALTLQGEDCGGHGHAVGHASLHVVGLVQDVLLEIPIRSDVAACAQGLHILRGVLVVLDQKVDGVEAQREIEVVRLQALQGEVGRADDVDLDVRAVLVHPPSEGHVAMGEALSARLAILQIVVALRVHTPVVGQVGQEGCVSTHGRELGVLHKIRILANDETNLDRHGYGTIRSLQG